MTPPGREPSEASGNSPEQTLGSHVCGRDIGAECGYGLDCDRPENPVPDDDNGGEPCRCVGFGDYVLGGVPCDHCLQIETETMDV